MKDKIIYFWMSISSIFGTMAMAFLLIWNFTSMDILGIGFACLIVGALSGALLSGYYDEMKSKRNMHGRTEKSGH